MIPVLSDAEIVGEVFVRSNAGFSRQAPRSVDLRLAAMLRGDWTRVSHEFELAWRLGTGGLGLWFGCLGHDGEEWWRARWAGEANQRECIVIIDQRWS